MRADERIAVSFSGGRTSAYMAWLLRTKLDAELRFVFMNTGQEHEATLEFVDRCSREWNLGVTWLEADVKHGERAGSGFTEVDFHSASRDGAPFEEVIRKYGIPNQGMPHCTRELKLNPFNNYLRSIGWWGECKIAVGIRADEVDRMQADAREKGIIYPLVSQFPADKALVHRFWESQHFDLELPSLLGNCTWCWKKTKRKHLTIAKHSPEIYDFPARMEAKYGQTGAGYQRMGRDQVFFRGEESALDIIASSKQPFEEWREAYNYDLFSEMDQPGGCVESCEVEF